MTTADIRKITDTMRYCLNHCDSDEETQMVRWVAGHLCNEIGRNQPNLEIGPLATVATARYL